MKKVLAAFLLVCSLGCYGQKEEFPSFDAVCRQMSEERVDELLEWAGALGVIARYIGRDEDEKIPLESIEGILAQWYQEKPELKLCTFDVTDILRKYQSDESKKYMLEAISDIPCKISYTDFFAICVSLLLHMPDDIDMDGFLPFGTFIKRGQEIVRVLKKLGVEQTISEDLLQALGKEFAQDVFGE